MRIATEPAICTGCRAWLNAMRSNCDRGYRIDEGKGACHVGRQLLYGAVKQNIHDAGMNYTDGQQQRPLDHSRGSGATRAKGASMAAPVMTRTSAIRCGGVPLRSLVTSAAMA